MKILLQGLCANWRVLESLSCLLYQGTATCVTVASRLRPLGMKTVRNFPDRRAPGETQKHTGWKSGNRKEMVKEPGGDRCDRCASQRLSPGDGPLPGVQRPWFRPCSADCWDTRSRLSPSVTSREPLGAKLLKEGHRDWKFLP